MNKKLSIGVLPNSLDFRHPQDRRRYVEFLSRMGLNYEVADFSRTYDILYISLSCDLNLWANYKKRHPRTRIIFDLSDNYLTGSWYRSVIRSVGHYLSGRTNFFKWDYRQTIQTVLNIADVVCVGSVEQKNFLMGRTFGNIIIVRDSFEEFGPPKYIGEKPPASGRTINIVWEGFPHSIEATVSHIRSFSFGLSNLLGSKISIVFVSDKVSCRYFGRYFCMDLNTILQREFPASCPVNVSFLEWSVPNLLSAVECSDFAIIPICGDEVSRAKPENKVLLFWYLGLPVIASSIPSYARIFKQFGLERYCCSSLDDWISAGSDIFNRQSLYNAAADDIAVFLRQELSTIALDRNMKTVFGI